jgi:DNA-binding NarL/FixJ family response regulator
MDLQMPDMNGVDAITAIRREFPEARTIVLTTYQGDVQALRAMKAVPPATCSTAWFGRNCWIPFETVHAGRRRIPPELAAEMIEHVNVGDLTESELQELREVQPGTRKKKSLHAWPSRRRPSWPHMRNILSKLNANDRAHAVVIAVKRGILET